MAESGKAESGKKVEVRFGAFSCSIEGYDNPVEQMREVLLLMQGMIRETPALADHGPGFGEAEVARIEHALDRRAERQAGGPGIVVIRGPEATRNGDDQAEDAVTTAEIPPGARRLAEDETETAPEPFPEIAPGSAPEPAEGIDEPPQVAAGDAGDAEDSAPGATPGIFAAPVAEDTAADQPVDEQTSDGRARKDHAGAEADDGQPERPLDDETGTAPAAAAIFSAPAAAMAEAAFSVDLAGTDEPEADARTAPGGEADADADRASLAEAGKPAETGQPDMAADADAAEHSDAPPAPGARAEEANHLWDDAAPPDFDEGPVAETAPVQVPDRAEALDEAAQPVDAPRTDQAAPDHDQPDPFARGEAAALPEEPQVAATNRQAGAEAGEHEWELPDDRGTGDAGEYAGPAAPSPDSDRSRHDAGEERSSGASDRDLQAAAEAALAAHGFGPGTAEDDRHPRNAGRGPDFAPPDFVPAGPPPAKQHDATAERRLNIFAPPPPPAGRATPAAAAINIFAPPPDAGAAAAATAATAATAVNIFAPPPGARARDTAQREAGRTGRLFSRTAAGTARQPAPDAWMAAAPDDEDDADPAPRSNGARRADGPGNGTRAADRSVNIFAAPHTATPQPATPPPALRREPGPAAAAWDSPAHEAGGEGDARPAGERPGTGWPGASWPGASWPGASWNDGLEGGEETIAGRSDRGAAGATDWNDGLREPPRPPRARPNEERSRFSALLARLGGRRAAEPEPEPEPTNRGPNQPSTTAREDGGDAGPADLAERAGATSVADLLSVAAAWLTLVEGKPRFTRREVMETFERLPGNHPRTLEARIKGFGKLVRSSTLILVDDGVFAMAQAERDRYQAMIDDG